MSSWRCCPEEKKKRRNAGHQTLAVSIVVWYLNVTFDAWLRMDLVDSKERKRKAPAEQLARLTAHESQPASSWHDAKRCLELLGFYCHKLRDVQQKCCIKLSSVVASQCSHVVLGRTEQMQKDIRFLHYRTSH